MFSSNICKQGTYFLYIWHYQLHLDIFQALFLFKTWVEVNNIILWIKIRVRQLKENHSVCFSHPKSKRWIIMSFKTFISIIFGFWCTLKHQTDLFSDFKCQSILDCLQGNTWWRHQMETFSALLSICAGNSLVPGEFPTQRPVTLSFDVVFDLCLNKRLSKQSWGWWFEMLSCYQYNDTDHA